MSKELQLPQICICGVGQTPYSRRSGLSEETLALSAVLSALEDAGLHASDLDGVIPGHVNLTAETLISNLDLPDVGFTCSIRLGGAASVAAIGAAALALSAGRAKYVVLFQGRNNASGPPIQGRVPRAMTGQEAKVHLERPFGWNTPAQYYSMICRRHMHEFGTTKKQMGMVAVTMRENAQLNEAAMMYGKPMTMEDYAASPMIADPYQKFDCCLESDGGAAIILTTADRAKHLRQKPVYLEAVAEGHPRSPDSLIGRQNWFDIGLTYAAPRAFASAGLRPSDVDVLLVYDCFTFEVLHQLEEAGFCNRGEAGPFVEAGGIARDGALPVNPNGGLMSEAHLGSVNNIIEAVRQLRGSAGPRQLGSASIAAVTGWGDLGDGSIALLSKEKI
jgi:acetyl-CoA acetyltransferase